MRVSELATRSGATSRSIRHYDRAGLLTSHRLPNGYRDFGDEAVDEVERIHALLAAGLSLRDIEAIGPCLDPTGGVEPCALAREILTRHVRRLDARIDADRRTRALLRSKLPDAPPHAVELTT